VSVSTWDHSHVRIRYRALDSWYKNAWNPENILLISSGLPRSATASAIALLYFKRSKGDKLKDYLKTNNVKPSEILVVGDTVEEIEIARELGAISVAITNGYNSTKRLKSKKPDYLLNDLRKIEGIITNINKI